MATKAKADPLEAWANPHEVDDVTVAFPARIVGTLLPPWELLPESQRREWHRDQWCKFASELFFNGGQIPPAKQGINYKALVRHIKAVLGSFEPKHEHKIAGAGWLLSQWCEGNPPNAA